MRLTFIQLYFSLHLTCPSIIIISRVSKDCNFFRKYLICNNYQDGNTFYKLNFMLLKSNLQIFLGLFDCKQYISCLRIRTKMPRQTFLCAILYLKHIYIKMIKTKLLIKMWKNKNSSWIEVIIYLRFSFYIPYIICVQKSWITEGIKTLNRSEKRIFFDLSVYCCVETKQLS